MTYEGLSFIFKVLNNRYILLAYKCDEDYDLIPISF